MATVQEQLDNTRLELIGYKNAYNRHLLELQKLNKVAQRYAYARKRWRERKIAQHRTADEVLKLIDSKNKEIAALKYALAQVSEKEKT